MAGRSGDANGGRKCDCTERHGGRLAKVKSCLGTRPKEKRSEPLREAMAYDDFAAGAADAVANSQGEIEAVDIPTTRNGLVEWLNLHFTTDNG
jgi:hypothetical protein